MSYQETREEEDLRRGIEKLRLEEQFIRGRRQNMEATLRKLVWRRMMKHIRRRRAAAAIGH